MGLHVTDGATGGHREDSPDAGIAGAHLQIVSLHSAYPYACSAAVRVRIFGHCWHDGALRDWWFQVELAYILEPSENPAEAQDHVDLAGHSLYEPLVLVDNTLRHEQLHYD